MKQGQATTVPAGAPDRPSKTRRKREMHALQELGERLMELRAEQLARIPLPDALREAVFEAQGITRHEARRRQRQYVGRLMREADAEAIREALAAVEGSSRQEIARQHRIERLREQLIDDEGTLARIAEQFPAADLQRLRALRRNARRESDTGLPPRSYRELFKALRELDCPESARQGEIES